MVGDGCTSSKVHFTGHFTAWTVRLEGFKLGSLLKFLSLLETMAIFRALKIYYNFYYQQLLSEEALFVYCIKHLRFFLKN
jgi:hypothetical protein